MLKNLHLSKLDLQPLPYFVINEITYIVFSMFFFDRGEVFFLGILKIVTLLTKFRISFVFLNILFTFVQNFKNLKRYDESKPNLIRPNQADDIQII